MSQLIIAKQIEKTLKNIVSHEDNPTIIFIYVDSSVDENMETVPFLNIYGNLIFDEENFDEALIQAVENNDSGYIQDVLEEIDSSSFEINISGFYPNWPNEVGTGDQKVIDTINSVINKNKKHFNLVEKLYFDHVDNFDFAKIIDKPILKNNSEIEIDKENNLIIKDNLQHINDDQQKFSLEKEAWDLVHSKQYDLAQEKCNAIKAIDPDYGFGYFLEARILWYKEGFEACVAKKDYFIAKTQHEPAALARIYNNYGCLYDLQLRYKESLPYFEKAILSNPEDGMYVSNIAELYCKLNNPKKAFKAAEKAKKLGHESSTLNAIIESKGVRYN
ncbi:tetratricopeptide repeat protein [Flavobacterium hydrophilum]|uniref:Uncharacterized protein n=1 Tax=Flavobacterium hydrophilum TaxID=2211445 RepID=A0A2V4C6P3_9FLAO|nr:hypothetical protein [Flavobacterium hydrophilum]PXY47008.1 hypothetical protein DMB68_07635 [Flavobacterium hydrophilum]